MAEVIAASHSPHYHPSSDSSMRQVTYSATASPPVTSRPARKFDLRPEDFDDETESELSDEGAKAVYNNYHHHHHQDRDEDDDEEEEERKARHEPQRGDGRQERPVIHVHDHPRGGGTGTGGGENARASFSVGDDDDDNENEPTMVEHVPPRRTYSSLRRHGGGGSDSNLHSRVGSDTSLATWRSTGSSVIPQFPYNVSMPSNIQPDKPLPDDSNVASRLPSICVDYLSHEWREDDVWTSWKAMTKHKKEVSNGVRLENASWRTWAKQRGGLGTISPETLNWLKDSDVTWLYGPLHTATDPDPPPRNDTLSNDGRSRSLPATRPHTPTGSIQPKKPILKYRSLSEILLVAQARSSTFEEVDETNTSPSEDGDWEAKHLDDDDDSPTFDNQQLAHTRSDTSISQRSTTSSRFMSPPFDHHQHHHHDSSNISRNNSATYLTRPGRGSVVSFGRVLAAAADDIPVRARHISFNHTVEQCIARDSDTEPESATSVYPKWGEWKIQQQQEEDQDGDDDDADVDADGDGDDDMLTFRSSRKEGSGGGGGGRRSRQGGGGYHRRRRSGVASSSPPLSQSDMTNGNGGGREQPHTIIPLPPTTLKSSEVLPAPSPVVVYSNAQSTSGMVGPVGVSPQASSDSLSTATTTTAMNYRPPTSAAAMLENDEDNDKTPTLDNNNSNTNSNGGLSRSEKWARDLSESDDQEQRSSPPPSSGGFDYFGGEGAADLGIGDEYDTTARSSEEPSFNNNNNNKRSTMPSSSNQGAPKRSILKNRNGNGNGAMRRGSREEIRLGPSSSSSSSRDAPSDSSTTPSSTDSTPPLPPTTTRTRTTAVVTGTNSPRSSSPRATRTPPPDAGQERGRSTARGNSSSSLDRVARSTSTSTAGSGSYSPPVGGAVLSGAGGGVMGGREKEAGRSRYEIVRTDKAPTSKSSPNTTDRGGGNAKPATNPVGGRTSSDTIEEVDEEQEETSCDATVSQPNGFDVVADGGGAQNGGGGESQKSASPRGNNIKSPRPTHTKRRDSTASDRSSLSASPSERPIPPSPTVAQVDTRPASGGRFYHPNNNNNNELHLDTHFDEDEERKGAAAAMSHSPARRSLLQAQRRTSSGGGSERRNGDEYGIAPASPSSFIPPYGEEDEAGVTGRAIEIVGTARDLVGQLWSAWKGQNPATPTSPPPS